MDVRAERLIGRSLHREANIGAADVGDQHGEGKAKAVMPP